MQITDWITAIATGIIAIFSFTTFVLSRRIHRSSQNYQDDIKKLTNSIKSAILVAAEITGRNQSTDTALKLFKKYEEEFNR